MSAKSKYLPRGVVVSLNTPFDEKDRLDLVWLERTVQRHLAEGAVRLVAPAHAGGVHALRLEERPALLAAWHERRRGRARLFAGATSNEHSEPVALAEAALRLGCDGVLVEAPRGAARAAGAAQGILSRVRAHRHALADRPGSGVARPAPGRPGAGASSKPTIAATALRPRPAFTRFCRCWLSPISPWTFRSSFTSGSSCTADRSALRASARRAFHLTPGTNAAGANSWPTWTAWRPLNPRDSREPSGSD